MYQGWGEKSVMSFYSSVCSLLCPLPSPHTHTHTHTHACLPGFTHQHTHTYMHTHTGNLSQKGKTSDCIQSHQPQGGGVTTESQIFSLPLPCTGKVAVKGKESSNDPRDNLNSAGSLPYKHSHGASTCVCVCVFVWLIGLVGG